MSRDRLGYPCGRARLAIMPPHVSLWVTLGCGLRASAHLRDLQQTIKCLISTVLALQQLQTPICPHLVSVQSPPEQRFPENRPEAPALELLPNFFRNRLAFKRRTALYHVHNHLRLDSGVLDAAGYPGDAHRLALVLCFVIKAEQPFDKLKPLLWGIIVRCVAHGL